MWFIFNLQRKKSQRYIQDTIYKGCAGLPLFQLQRPLLEVATADTRVQISVHPQPEVVAWLLLPHDAGSHPLSRAIREPTP